MTLINEEIVFDAVSVIGADDNFIGTYSSPEALTMARKQGLDLVCLNEKGKTPVVKIMSYDKFRYDQKKNGKKQKVVEIKELRIRATTSKHDLETKSRQAEKFLANGDKVKISLIMKGRERQLVEQANNTFNTFLSLMPTHTVETARSAVNGTISITIKS